MGEATLKYNKKKCYGGQFENEEHAAMKVNLLCDEYETKRQNPTIEIKPEIIQKSYEKTKSKMAQSATENTVDERIKVEDKNILHGFKAQYEHRFIQSNDEESCIDRASCQNQKRKRKEDNDVKVEEVEIATYKHVEYGLLQEIQNNYAKIHD